MTDPAARPAGSPRPDYGHVGHRAARRLVGWLVLVAGLLAACSSSGPTPSSSGASSSATSSPPGSAVITIRNFAFHPATLTVKKGTLIKVVNDDQVAHTLTALNHSFDTGDISGGGGTASFRVQDTGTFPYMCTIHPFMHGTLTVVS